MNEMGLFWEAEAYYNVGDLVFNNRQVEVTIDPKGAMGRYDVNVSAQVSAMDSDPAFEPMNITLPSMKGVVQFVNDKVFKSSGMAGEPEAQTELPFGKGGLAKENKMKITKSQLQKIIKEEMDMMRRRITTGDPVGPQEANDVAEFLETTHGLRFSRDGMGQMIEFLAALEAAGDLGRIK
jgi:hypothetical protein